MMLGGLSSQAAERQIRVRGTGDLQMGFKRRAGSSAVVILGAALAAGAAQAGAFGVGANLATPSFPTSVSAADGMVAWAAGSGSGHRFEIVVRAGTHERALSATSAVGWIDGVKLGSDSRGRAIVVYSRCPHSPFASADAGSAGTDGCRLWWAPTSGGSAHRIAAAPADTSIGLAEHGVVVFAVQPNTAHQRQPARLETAHLTGTAARTLEVPTPDGATIDDISADGSDVAFSEATESSANLGVSQIWLDSRGAAPRLIARITSDGAPLDDSEQFFDGLTLTSEFVYAFEYSQHGIVPPVASQLEQISLGGLATMAAPWAPSAALRGDGVEAAAFDPSNERLVLDLFSPQLEFSTPSASCSTHAGSARACPVVQSEAITFG